MQGQKIYWELDRHATSLSLCVWEGWGTDSKLLIEQFTV